MKKTIIASVALSLLAPCAFATDGPARQVYDLGEFGSVFFGGGLESGGAELSQDLGFCTAEVRLEWQMLDDQLALTVSKNGCAEMDAHLSDVFSADCPDGWPDLQVGDSQSVCWFTPGPVTRTQ